MRPRHPVPIPRVWLMTDERMGADLWPALRRLPRGSGVIVRHYTLPAGERRALMRRVTLLGRARGLVVLGARMAGPDGSHGGRPRRGLRSAAAHDLAELAEAHRAGADVVFVSPIFPTRSHPGAPVLGPMRFAAIARRARCPVIALGGMTAVRFRRVRPLGAHGWAAIDAWVESRPVKAVTGV